MDEFSFKDMRTRDRSKIKSYCIGAWFESGELWGRRSSRFPCVTLRHSCQTSTTEFFCQNSQRPKHVDCFRKKPPPQTSDRILYADPTRGVVNVECGWNVSAWNLWLVYKKSYFWWNGNPTCGDSTGINRTGKDQARVSPGSVWGKRGEGTVWFSVWSAFGWLG